MIYNIGIDIHFDMIFDLLNDNKTVGLFDMIYDIGIHVCFDMVFDIAMDTFYFPFIKTWFAMHSEILVLTRFLIQFLTCFSVQSTHLYWCTVQH
jgi:hypothetical protein